MNGDNRPLTPTLAQDPARDGDGPASAGAAHDGADGIEESEISGSIDRLIGSLVSERYRVIRVVGRGGMGVVYEAEHTELARTVALKVLGAAWASDEQQIARFQREARSASSLGHPNIVGVYDLGRLDDGRPYLAMEYLDGRSLAELLSKEDTISVDTIVSCITQVASALDAVHAKGIVHRDIKPENLILLPVSDPTSFIVKLVDFGLAAFTQTQAGEQRLTRHGQIHGTPEYMAPESAGPNLPDHRADVYSLTVVAFELLTRRLPFESVNPLFLLTQKFQRDAPSLRSITGRQFPARLERVIAKGLARSSSKRYQTAGVLAAELKDAIEELDVAGHASASTSSVVERADLSTIKTKTPSRMTPFTWLALGGVALVAAGAVFLAISQTGGPDPAVPFAVPTERAASASRERQASSERRRPAPGVGAQGGSSNAEGQEAVVDPSSTTSAPEPSRQLGPERVQSSERSRPSSARSRVGPRTVAQGARSRADDGADGADGSEAPPARADRDRSRAKELTDEGTKLLVQGRVPDAIDRFRAATIAHPRYAPAWRSLGLANQRIDRAPEAIRAYERYLRLAPGARDARAVRQRLDDLE